MRKSGGNIPPASGLPQSLAGCSREAGTGWRQTRRSPCTPCRVWRGGTGGAPALSLFSPLPGSVLTRSPSSPEQPPSVTPGIRGGHHNELPSQETDPGQPEPKKEAKASSGSRLRLTRQAISGPQPLECSLEGQAWISRLKPPYPPVLPPVRQGAVGTQAGPGCLTLTAMPYVWKVRVSPLPLPLPLLCTRTRTHTLKPS